MNNNLKYLITQALLYTDKKNEKLKKFIEKISNSVIPTYNYNIDEKLIFFYDKEGEKFFESRFEYLGAYYNKYNIWTWAWVLPYFTKKETKISRKLLNYGLNIEQKLDNKMESFYLKSELLNSRFKISDSIQIDIHLALTSYLSKNEIKYIHPLKVKIGKKNDIENYIIYYVIILDEIKI